MTQTQRKGQPGEGSSYSPRSRAAASGLLSPAHRAQSQLCSAAAVSGLSPASHTPHSPRPGGCQAGAPTGQASKLGRDLGLCHHQCSPQHPSPLQQRHQKHLKIAPEARAPRQLSCCPLLAPPLCCCSVEARSSLTAGSAGVAPSGESHAGSRS